MSYVDEQPVTSHNWFLRRLTCYLLAGCLVSVLCKCEFKSKFCVSWDCLPVFPSEAAILQVLALALLSRASLTLCSNFLSLCVLQPSRRREPDCFDIPQGRADSSAKCLTDVLLYLHVIPRLIRSSSSGWLLPGFLSHLQGGNGRSISEEGRTIAINRSRLKARQ